MTHRTLQRRLQPACAVAFVTALVAAAGTAQATTASTPSHVTGSLPDGATYVMDVPAQWNGTVLLYSHGIVPAGIGIPNTAQNAPSGLQTQLLQEGYALIGSSYVTAGWVVDTAVSDQIATLDAFQTKFGPAQHTIAWGGSMGGLVTTKLAEEYGNRIDGSLALCGLEMGGTAEWNALLDASYAVRTLLAPTSGIQLTGYANPGAAQTAAAALTSVAGAAQTTAAGRARIALATALYNVPAYNTVGQTVPAANDWTTAEVNQYQDLTGILIATTTSLRQDAETHAGGNMSWNTGVDYSRILVNSVDLTEVRALYRAAGLSLDGDLKALNTAPRISADPAAVQFMAGTSSLTGELTKPQLDVHTIGDGLVPVQAESAYQTEVRAAGNASLLRETYVNAPGHCNFTSGEELAAVKTIDERVITGHWSSTSAATMNQLSLAADPTDPTLYVSYRPAVYPRPFYLTPVRR